MSKTPAQELRDAGGDADKSFGDAPAGSPVQPCPAGGLEIIDMSTDKAAVATRSPPWVVGQMVRLQVRSCPGGRSVTNVEWTIEGETVKDYTVSDSKAVRTNLGRADLKKTEVAFYWITGGTKTVTVTASVSGQPATATAAFDVLAPTYLGMRASTGSMRLDYVGGTPFLCQGIPDTPIPRGVELTAEAMSPKGLQGFYGMFLLIQPANLIQGPDWLERIDSKGRYWCADEAPIDSGKFPRTRQAYGEMKTTMRGEYPGFRELSPSYTAVTIIEHLRLFFMFIPDPHYSHPNDPVPEPATRDPNEKILNPWLIPKLSYPSIWVPLGRLDWWRSAGATHTDPPGFPGLNIWTGPIGPVGDADPVGAATAELPTWEYNFNEVYAAALGDPNKHAHGIPV